MPTQCSQEELDFGSSGGRKLVGAFDGGAITSNGGALLLGAADRSIRLTDRLAKCFRDLRLADGITHTIADLLRQRIFGLALGYEDLIDHDQLRHDPALAAVLDKPGGRLAGKSTLNRLEHADKIGQDRHHKFDHDGAAIERKRAATSTATTIAIATCRFTSSAAGICSRPSCGHRAPMRRKAVSRKLPASWLRSASAGPRPASCSAPTVGSAATT